MMFSNIHPNQWLPARQLRFESVLCTMLNYLLACLLAFSGVPKLVDASGVLAALQLLSFLNEAFIIWIATLLPVVELGLAAALFMQWKPSVILPITWFLFVIFLSFAIYGLAVGWSGDCGCFGGWAESGFGWGMILRNSLLFCAAGFLWMRKSHA